MENNTEKKVGFFTKVKNALIKFFKGLKNFFVKTARVNSSNCYGIVDGIGDLLVYDDHALISAVGMADVTFTKANVLSTSFEGLGNIRRKKATVKYKIELDDNVVFPEKVREKNDVKNITVTISIDKETSHLLGHGTMKKAGEIANCDVYGYGSGFVIALNLEKRVGDRVEKYQESLWYAFSAIAKMGEGSPKTFIVQFNDDKILEVTAINDIAYRRLKEIEEKK